MKYYLFQVAIAAFICSLNLSASELLPFPEESTSSKRTKEKKSKTEFEKSVEKLECPDLKSVEDGLRDRINNSKTTSDRKFYKKNLHIVVDAKIKIKCR